MRLCWRRWLLVVAIHLAVPALAQSPVDGALAPLDAFSSRCAGCHDDPDDDTRPYLTASMTPEQATRAMRAVLEGAMPPGLGQLRLKIVDKVKLVRELCTLSMRSRHRCEDLVRLIEAPPRVRPPPAMMRRMLGQSGPRPPKFAGFLQALHYQDVLHTSLGMAMTLSVVELCSRASTKTPSGDSAQDSPLNLRRCLVNTAISALASPVPPAREGQ